MKGTDSGSVFPESRLTGFQTPGTLAQQRGLGEHPVQSIALEESKALSPLIQKRLILKMHRLPVLVKLIP